MTDEIGKKLISYGLTEKQVSSIIEMINKRSNNNFQWGYRFGYDNGYDDGYNDGYDDGYEIW